MRGRPDGSYVVNHIRLPVIYAAIQGAEKPQDLNRMLLVEMQKIRGKNSPANVILDEFGGEKIKEMAHKIATVMYPHALTLARYEKEMRQNFKELQATMPFQVEWRYASSLFSIMALLRFLEQDWKMFFRNFLIKNESTILQASTISESETLVNAMLYNSVIKSDGNLNDISIALLLIAPESRTAINTSSCGVFFDGEQRLLLFLLEQAVPKLLPQSLRPRGLSGSYLKGTLERHPAALKPHEVISSKILRKVGPYLGAGIKPQDVIVLHADQWLESNNESIDTIEQEILKPKEVKKEVKDAPAKKEDNKDPGAGRCGNCWD
jgi:hypothetical protein